MKAVLIGADLMYRQDGKIVPIEINTNVGWDEGNRKETLDSVFDLTDLINYATEHGITDVYLEGNVGKITQFWPAESSITCHTVSFNEMNGMEDSETSLLIRTSYNDEAYVDNFCRDKINFLNSIKDEEFGAEYLLKSEGNLYGEITTIYDNGVYPNFIVKYRYPHYDKDVYPQAVRFTSLEQLQSFAEEQLEDDYFIMPFYYNAEKVYEEVEEGHETHRRLQFLRNWSAFVANAEGSLDSVQLGRYTKLSSIIDESKLEWNEDGTSANPEDIRKMLFPDKWTSSKLGDTLLDEDDVVLMEDNTWKKAQDLEVGDRVQAISIPISGNVDIRAHTGDYNIPYEELEENSSWVINEIQSVRKIECWYDEVAFTFTDGTDWYDTAMSSYPTLDPEDGSVRFTNLEDLKEGDKIILMPIDAESLENPTFTVKEVASVETNRKLQHGYSIGLLGNYLFLSRTSEDEEAYIAIEHNAIDPDADTVFACAANDDSNSIISSIQVDGQHVNDFYTAGQGCYDLAYIKSVTCVYAVFDMLFTPAPGSSGSPANQAYNYFTACVGNCNYIGSALCASKS